MKIDALLKSAEPSEIKDKVRRLEELGYDGVWTFEAQNDPFLPLSFALNASRTLSLGTNITVAFARSPFALAQTSWDLQRFAKGRFKLGLGTQVKAHLERRYSIKSDKPAAKIEEYIICLRAIWDSFQNGNVPNFNGEFYKFSLLTDFFNPGPNPCSYIPIYLAGVNPLMCEVAGRVADGFHVHPMHTTSFLKDMIIPNINRGLNVSENPRRNFELYAPIFVITGHNDREKAKMKKTVCQQIAFYGSTPNYASLFSYHGYPELGKKLNTSLKRGEIDAMGDLIPDDLLEQIAVIDNPENIAKRIVERYLGTLNRVSLYCSLDNENASDLLIDLPVKVNNLLAVIRD